MSPAEVIALYAQLACVWEATARKPGNVHRYQDFEDCTYLDFVTSAAVLGPVLGGLPGRSVGATVLEAVQQTRRVAPNNTNLGIALLLAPLAKATTEQTTPPPNPLPEAERGSQKVDEVAGSASPLIENPAPPLRFGEGVGGRGCFLNRSSVEEVLAGLTVADAVLVYEAIRTAKPGGLGEAPEQDVSAQPTQTLREVMALAADRDLVARQYANGFAEVFDEGVPALLDGLERTGSLEGAIIHAHLFLMGRHPDTLIARKRGRAEADEAATRARRALAEGGAALTELDGWLRAVGHARNPGTTADLIAACLFVMLCAGTIRLPLTVPWVG